MFATSVFNSLHFCRNCRHSSNRSTFSYFLRVPTSLEYFFGLSNFPDTSTDRKSAICFTHFDTCLKTIVSGADGRIVLSDLRDVRMNPTITTNELGSLLSVWHARRDAGQPCEPADLCPDDLALQNQLREFVSGIRRMEQHANEIAQPDELLERTTDSRYGSRTVVTVGLVSPPELDILDELGHGAMGAVFRAVQIRLQRTVALKVMLNRQGSGQLETACFLAEGEAMAAVRHPNVVQVYDCGEHDGKPYLTMELLTGGTLKERLKAGRLHPQVAANLLEKLARGVHAVHQKGIVHRDLKPGNVLFDADGTPKVADFGLAKRENSEDAVASGDQVGTPAYMCPEQARGQSKFVGPTADVWSLGVVLYECLTGQRPFNGKTPLDVMHQIIQENPARLSSHAVVPPDLERVCMKCLAKNPADRYQSAEDLAEDLKAFCEWRSVSVRPVPKSVEMCRWTARNPVSAGLVIAVLVGLVASAGFFHQWQVAAEAEGRWLRSERNSVIGKMELESMRQLVRAEQASQSGDASTAIAAYDAAERAGAILTDEQRIDRVSQLFEISSPDLREYLDAVEPASLAPLLRGKWHILNGAELLNRDEAGAVAELKLGLDLVPVESADAYYAKALLETDAEKSLMLLELTIAANPTAQQPRLADLLIRFLLGRHHEVIHRVKSIRLLAPENPQIALLQYLSQNARREKGDIKRTLAALRTTTQTDRIDLAASFGTMFARIREADNLCGHCDNNMLFTNPNFVRSMLFGNQEQATDGSTILDSNNQKVLASFARTPLCVRPLARMLGLMVSSSVGEMYRTRPRSSTSQLTDEQFTDLQKMVRKQNEGSLRFWCAMELAARSRTMADGRLPAERRVSAGEAETIAEQFESAWQAKGFVFDARTQSLDAAILYYAIAAVGVANNQDVDLRLAEKCCTLIRERLNDERVRERPIPYIQHYYRATQATGQAELTALLIERWKKQSPNDQELAHNLAQMSR
jgi:serine/threonine protein kinase